MCCSGANSSLALTAGTVEAGALAQQLALDRRAAHEASLPFAAVDLQTGGESSRLAARVAIVAESRTAAADRLGQDTLGMDHDALGLCARNPAGGAARTHPRPEQNLAGVDVADARHHVLIHQEIFDRHAPAARLFEKVLGAERFLQRLGTERSKLIDRAKFA